MDKLEVARRQLGTALHLFLHELDPVSVHVLLCGGAEVAEGLASAAEKPIMRKFALASRPEMTDREYSSLRTSTWNAFKHANGWKGKPRDDRATLENFNDADHAERLFAAWFDYGRVSPKLPVEARVLLQWFLALDLRKFGVDVPSKVVEEIAASFPGLGQLPKAEQMQALRDAIDKARASACVMGNPGIDPRPLILG